MCETFFLLMPYATIVSISIESANILFISNSVEGYEFNGTLAFYWSVLSILIKTHAKWCAHASQNASKFIGDEPN